MSISRLLENIRPYFPYKEVRLKQDYVINKIYTELLESKRHIVISAPNGYGKTILSLVSVLPLIKDKNKKVIYLCRTHTQIQRVIDELIKINSELKKNNLDIQLSGIGLRGRNTMCFHPLVVKLKDPNLAQLMCTELRKGNKCLYYTNIIRKPERVDFLLSILHLEPMDGAQLVAICKDHNLCPYMISRIALSKVDLVACNYQWIFNPFIRKRFLEMLNVSLNDLILIIDEAHNLPDIATEIGSIRLTEFSVKSLIKEIEAYKKEMFYDFSISLKNIFDEFKKKDFEELAIIPKYILKKMEKSCKINKNFFNNMIEIGKEIRELKVKEGKAPYSYIYSVGNFFINWYNVIDNPSYFFIASKYRTKQNEKYVALEILSLDPREILKNIFNEIEGSLHMSGTINPDAYVDSIGLPDSTIKFTLPSLWSSENMKVFALKGITSKGTSRSLDMYKQMLEHIKIAIEYTPKNIGIFAASYDILRGLRKAGIEKIKTNKKIYIENPAMTSKENDNMIKNFKNQSKKAGGVLLGVCGGRNAEGEDFPGDYMNTVIVCGIPFARPSVRVQAAIDYYNKIWGKEKGKDLSYNVPALRRANQAAGRPIRTLDDRGVIILMDYRYATRYFRRFLANWISEKMIILENDPNQLKKELERFYWHK